MNKLLIWDIDGTLIQGKGIGRRAMDRTFLELFGIEEGFKGIDMAGMLDSNIIKRTFEAHGLKAQNTGAFFDRYCEYLSDEVKRLTSKIVAPGVVDVLEALDIQEGFYHVLGTGNIERGARIKLSHDNLNRFFQIGGFGDEESERWQVIHKAYTNSCELFGIAFDNKDTYVIGDTPKDIECGKILNYKSIGVATGTHTYKELADCKANFVLENLLNLREFLDIFK